MDTRIPTRGHPGSQDPRTPPLRLCWRARIDTNPASATEGDLIDLLLEAKPFKTAEAVRLSLLDCYRSAFPAVGVQVDPEPVLVASDLAPGLYLARTPLPS